MLSDTDLVQMAVELSRTPGIVGVVLGGSRARGDALPSSDVDLGLYYGEGLDPEELTVVARRWSGDEVRVGPLGSWGPWVDAGAWLTVDDTSVDWILRRLARVRASWAAAQRGDFAFHAQAGHPLGFLDVAYAGELALGRILADPTGQLSSLQVQMQVYPPLLSEAISESVWEAGFLVDSAKKGVERADTTYVALCLSRALMICAHALHARARCWVTNEKGLVPSVARLASSPAGFSDEAAAIMSALAIDPAALADAVELARGLVRATERYLHPER